MPILLIILIYTVISVLIYRFLETRNVDSFIIKLLWLDEENWGEPTTISSYGCLSYAVMWCWMIPTVLGIRFIQYSLEGLYHLSKRIFPSKD